MIEKFNKNLDRVDLQREIIGEIIFDRRDAWMDANGLIERDMFTDVICLNVFDIISELFEFGMDWDLTIIYLEYDKRFGCAPNIVATLASITSFRLSKVGFVQKILYLKEATMQRNNRELAMKLLQGGDTIGNAVEVQEALTNAITKNTEDDWMDMSQVMISLINHMDTVKDKEILGVPSGISTIDTVISGFQPGQVCVIAARPSQGKSALATTIAVNAAKQNHKVAIISLEMPEDQLGGRMASIYSGVEFWRIYRNKLDFGNSRNQIHQVTSEMSNLPIMISTKTNVTGGSIRYKTEKLMRKNKGIDLLIIDYLQLIEGDGNKNDNRERELSKLSRRIKLMAMDLNIPVIVLAQLNRESEKSKNEKPKMSQIRESGAIEQDADVVMLLHRDFKSGIVQNENGESTEFEADIIIEKNRNGETLTCKVAFDPQSMKFSDKVENSYISPFKTDHNDFNRLNGNDVF